MQLELYVYYIVVILIFSLLPQRIFILILIALIANYPDCVNQGWSLLVFAAQAEIGDWKGAWERMQAVNESVFYEAGGNGHSRANSLWYVSTRPDYKKALPTVTGRPSKSPTSTLMPSRPVMNYEKPTARPSYTTTLYPTYSRFGH